MTAFAHQALVYGSDGEFLDGASAFLKDGSATGEHAVVVTTPRNIELLTQAGFTQRQCVEYIDAAAWYTAPGATLGAFYQRVQQHRGPGLLRVIGEPVWSGRTPLQVT